MGESLTAARRSASPMLTVRDLLADLDVAARSRARTASTRRSAGCTSPSSTDPTPWLSGGELLLTTGIPLDTRQASATTSTLLADHGLAGLGFGTGFAHAKVPKALRRGGRRRAASRCSRSPTRLPFIAITERAFARLVNEQYALLQRGRSPCSERLERHRARASAASRRSSRAIAAAGRRHRRSSSTAAASSQAQRTRSAARSSRGRRGARRRARATARAAASRAAFVPAHAGPRARARSRCRSVARRADGGAAAGLAGRRQGRRRARRVRAPDPAPGGRPSSRSS